MLFLRERRRNNEIMDMIRTMMEEAAEERRQAAESAAEERRQAAESAAEERRQAAESAAEERRQAALERQAFLDTLNRLTESIGQNGRGEQ